MWEPLSNMENLTLLARDDFLDLCLLGETSTRKTHTARLTHLPEPLATLFASGTATEHFTEAALKESVENRPNKRNKLTRKNRNGPVDWPHLNTAKHRPGTGRRRVWDQLLRVDWKIETTRILSLAGSFSYRWCRNKPPLVQKWTSVLVWRERLNTRAKSKKWSGLNAGDKATLISGPKTIDDFHSD